MTTFDYVLGAICVCVLIYQIILMLRMQRTAVVRGKSINKKAVTLIILALLALATISLAGSSYNAFLYFRF